MIANLEIVSHGHSVQYFALRIVEASQTEFFASIMRLKPRSKQCSFGPAAVDLDQFGAEGDSPNHYKLSKQADVLMLFYLFSAEELAQIFSRLGYGFDGTMIPETIDYYLRQTSHGSTSSGIAHAWVLARCCRRRSWPLFTEALHSDIDDIQGGTTPEGIYLEAMAGTVDLLQRCYTGLELRGNELHFNPVLPDELKRLSFRMRYRGHSLFVDVTPDRLAIASDPSDVGAISIVVDEQTLILQPGTRRSIRLRHPEERADDRRGQLPGADPLLA